MRRLILASALLLAVPGATVATVAAQGSSSSPDRVAKAAAAPKRTAANTRLLCGKSGQTEREAKRRPSVCSTLGPKDSFAEAVNLKNLKWKHWGASTATATGTEVGFREDESNISVKVTVSAPKANTCDPRGFSYTRLKSTSKYGTTTQTLPAVCFD